MVWRSFVRAAVILGFVALGCSGSRSSPTEPRRLDAIRLLSLTPAESTSLRLGEPAAITAQLHYSFATAPRGKILVTAYPAPVGLPIPTDPISFAVEGAEGEATIHFTIELNVLEPGELANHPPLLVSFALFPEGVNQTQVQVMARYQLTGP